MLNDFQWLTSAELIPHLIRAARILIILVGAFLLSRIVHGIIRRTEKRIITVMEAHGDMGSEAIKKRTATIESILRTLSTVLIGRWPSS